MYAYIFRGTGGGMERLASAHLYHRPFEIIRKSDWPVGTHTQRTSGMQLTAFIPRDVVSTKYFHFIIIFQWSTCQTHTD